MELHISLTTRTRLGEEIYRQVRQAIVDGRLRAGELLPPSRHLALTLGVSRSTVTVAYDRLGGEGFVDSRVGAGTFVSARGAPVPSRVRVQRQRNPLHARPIWNSVALSTASLRSVTARLNGPGLFRSVRSRRKGIEIISAIASPICDMSCWLRRWTDTISSNTSLGFGNVFSA